MEPYLPTRTTGVPFYFSVESIKASNAVSNRDGSFQPRQSPLHHTKVDKEGWLFYFDGNNTRPAASYPSNLQTYESHMIYYDSGRFYIAAEDLDHQHETAHRGDACSDIAWRPLAFSPLACNPHPNSCAISYAYHRGISARLIQQTRAEAQGWPFKLLPQQHHCKNLVHHAYPSGLTGDLSLLIALLAMTIPSPVVPILLPELIAHDQYGPNWHTHEHLPAQSGWKSRRGLYVKVMYDDQQVTPTELQSYGAGEYGVLFCRP